jgi:centrosomal CEP192-like protein/HYDIN/CFA65/VesB family protein
VSRNLFLRWLSASVASRGWRGRLRTVAILSLCIFIAGGFSLLGAQNRRAPAARKGSGSLVFSPANRQQANRSLACLPWAFEPNVGQADGRVKFLARADGATVFLTQNEAVIAWSAPQAKDPRAAQKSQNDLRLQFVGASKDSAISGKDELPGKTNYLLGNNPRQWRTNIPHFSAVAYNEIYRGINARFYGGPLGLEYDFAISPGSDPGSIVLRTGEASQLRLDRRGNLLVDASGHEILMRRPEIYQLNGARKIPVEGGYRLLSANSFGFRVGPHHRGLPLVIDPSISVTYTSFLGGNGAEKGNSVAVDSAGAIYVGGTTADIATFPETSTSSQGPLSGASKLFVAKVDTTQSGAASLVYLTFIGGSGDDEGGKVAVDNSASPPSLAVLGWTTSTDFPTTLGSVPTGAVNLTVSKLNGAGSAFVFSEYYGGNGSEATQGTGAIVTNSTGGGITTDSAGDVLVTSDTTSTNLPQPAVPNGFQLLFEGTGTAPSGTNNDGFLAKFDPPGALLYSTYFGITAMVGSTSVAVDTTGNAYVAGFTSSGTGFPATNAFQSGGYAGGAFDAFIMQINANPPLVPPTTPVYASLLGGSSSDQAFAIALDNQSPPSAYVTGSTSSTDFVPSSLQPNSFQPCFGSTSSTPCSASAATSNAFFAVVSQTSSTFVPSLAYASYLGGTSSDSGLGVAVVSTSNVLVAGKTTSADFPVLCPSQNFTGTSDAFIAGFNPTASGFASLLDSTFLGGSANTEANAIATDSTGDAIIFGDTTSSDYPLGANPNPNNGFQPICTSCGSSLSDAFLTKSAISTAPSGCIAFNPASANFGSFPVGSTTVPPFSGVVTNEGNATLNVTALAVVGANAADFQILAGTNCTSSSVLAPAASCDVSIGFTPTVAGQETAALQLTDDGAGSPQSLDLLGTGNAPEVTLTTSPPTSPPALTFGSVTQGTTSPSQSVTLTNTGNTNLTVSSITIDPSAGNPSDWTLPSTGSCLSGPIAPGVSCVFAVAFSPNTTGPLTGQVDIVDDNNNVSGSTQTIALSGTGINQTFIVGFSPTSLAFPNQPVGMPSSPMSVTLTNTGTGTLNITSIAFTGVNANQFLFDSTTTCPVSGGSVGPNGGACVIAVDFAPTVVGSASASISIADNASNSPQTVPISGTGAGAIASLSTNTLTFGSVQVGTTSAVQTATLTNTGNSNLIINTNGLTITGTNPGDFQLAAQTTCVTGGSGIAPNTSCAIAVDFVPQASGSRFATVSISDNAGGSPQTISLTGTGTQPVASLSQTSLSFGSVNVNTSSTAPSVTLTNSGNQTLTISSVSINPAFGNPGDFTFSSAPGSNTCKTVGALQPVGGNPNSCTITITFTPAAQGSRMGEVDISDNASPSTQTISLSGTGTAPGVSLAPSSLNLGSEDIGSKSAAQNVTLTNTGSGPLTINAVGFSGANPGDFGETNSCPISPAQLASGNACIISVTFTPTAKGARSASLSVSDTGPGSPQTVGLSGTGTQPAVALSPSTGVSFPPTVVGVASGTRALTVTNTGDGPLDVSNITFSGANAGDFSETDNCIGAANAVAPQKSCTINVNFVPAAMGTRSANLVLTDNASPPTQQVPVGGQATDFQLVASGGVTTATVTAGEIAIFPLQVNPQNGFTGTVTFGCINPPPKGTCTIAPPSIQMTGSTPVSFSVSVGTKSNALLIPRSPQPWRTPRIPAILWWLAALLCLFIWRRAAGRKRRLVPRFVLAFATLLLASCGSGGSTTGGNGTPPGTYIVTATGSVGSGAARTLNLTVMVQ